MSQTGHQRRGQLPSQMHPAVRNDSGPPRPHARRAHLLGQDQMLRGAQVCHDNPRRSDVASRQQLPGRAHLLPQPQVDNDGPAVRRVRRDDSRVDRWHPVVSDGAGRAGGERGKALVRFRRSGGRYLDREHEHGAGR